MKRQSNGDDELSHIGATDLKWVSLVVGAGLLYVFVHLNIETFGPLGVDQNSDGRITISDYAQWFDSLLLAPLHWLLASAGAENLEFWEMPNPHPSGPVAHLGALALWLTFFAISVGFVLVIWDELKGYAIRLIGWLRR